MMLVWAALKGHVAAIGDCSGAFHQALFEPRRNRKPSLNRATSRGRAGTRLHMGSRVGIPRVSREHRDCGTRTVRTSSRVPWRWNNHDTTVACSIRFEPRREHIEEKARRHIDDFLVTGPEPNVERFLAKARDKLNMQDAVRLYKAGDESRLLAMNLRQLENGYSLQGKPLHIHGIATAFGTENAKASLIPRTINEKAQDGDDEILISNEARTFKTCVGKAMYLSHHRPDIQHSVNTLSRSMRNPTMIAMRRLKKLTRHLLGRSEVYQNLSPDPPAAGLTTKKIVQSCNGGAVFLSRTQCSRVHAHRRPELFRAQRPSGTALAQEQSKVWGEAQFLQEWQYKNSTAASARLTVRTMKHIELKMLTVQERLKAARLRIHKVSTHDNPADLMTKAMTREKLIKFGRALNLRGSFFTDLSQPTQ